MGNFYGEAIGFGVISFKGGRGGRNGEEFHGKCGVMDTCALSLAQTGFDDSIIPTNKKIPSRKMVINLKIFGHQSKMHLKIWQSFKTLHFPGSTFCVFTMFFLVNFT